MLRKSPAEGEREGCAYDSFLSDQIWTLQVGSAATWAHRWPVVFREMMNSIFIDFRDQLVMMVIDDSRVYSRSREEYAEHLRMALQVLRDRECYVEFLRYELRMSEVASLG